MAYFEYGYVNTGYDENSAEPPQAGEHEVICNFPYSTFDVVNQTQYDFNYDITNDGVYETQCDFSYDVFDSYIEKMSQMKYSVAGFISKEVEINYSISKPVFEHGTLALNYSILGGASVSSGVRIVRKDMYD